MKKIILTLLSIFIISYGFSQTDGIDKGWCGLRDNTLAIGLDISGNLGILENAKARRIIIPVVVHVIYKDSSEIPTLKDIQGQIDGLSDDFNADNWDVLTVDSEFKRLVADTKISFKLATIDPKGGKTSGITYTKTDVSYFLTDDLVKYDTSGGKDIWDGNQYLNLWICNLASARGYAQFPNQKSETDGVVVDYRDIGIYDEFTDKYGDTINSYCRVLTHEVGHWLGLFHIWGDEYCGNDGIKDTPIQYSPHWYCPNNDDEVTSCGSVDLTNNYMDYNDFECMVMFTKGQKKRMWKVLAMYRKQLLRKSNQKLIE